ncbi:MAG: 4-oxalocrotonate tautomerase family protein [Gammaproteobacteria bacterium]|nr:4-oxalocrotonate tautomerase family protein [Gammaproteobacteria bacterium]
MPFLQVHILEGRDEALRARLIEALTNTVCDVLGSPKEAVRIVIDEVPKENWGIGGQSAKALGR